jgi:DNA polymerase III delta subunit
MEVSSVSYLEEAHTFKNGIHVILGDDEFLKEMVANKALQTLGNSENQEKMEIGNVLELIGMWEEGSLMGPKTMFVTLSEKVSNLNHLDKLKWDISNDDRLILKPREGWNDRVKKSLAGALFVECSSLKGKEKKIFLRSRALAKKVALIEETEDLLLERCSNALEIEITLGTLSLLGVNASISRKEIIEITNSPEEYKDLARSILRRNYSRLVKDLMDGEPLLNLTILFNTLLKLFIWLNTDHKNKESHEETLESLKIRRNAVKDWEMATKLYSSQVIRQAAKEINDLYQGFITGRSESWREKLKLALRKLG